MCGQLIVVLGIIHQSVDITNANGGNSGDKMAKKSKRAKLTKVLDGLCLKIVRLETNNLCQRCGKYVTGSNSHPAHIVPKGKGASWRRFDLINILHLCFHCHRWWHENPLESAEYFRKKFPIRAEYLKIYQGGKSAKISTSEMEELVDKYKIKLEELEVKDG